MAIKTRHFVNLNDHVRVRLTDHGKAILREQHRDLHCRLAARGVAPPLKPYEPPSEDEAGWSTWQLWSLFANFGPHMTCLSSPNCFALDIEIGVD